MNSLSNPIQKDFFACLFDKVERKGNEPVFQFYGAEGNIKDSLSYNELSHAASRIACELTQKQGLVRGDRVLLFYPPGLAFTKSLLGCMYAGIIPVPVAVFNPLSPNEWLETVKGIALNCDAKAILTETTMRRLKFLGSVKSFFTGRKKGWPSLRWLNTDSMEGRGSVLKPEPVDDDSLAFLQYTSGSTSAPKGVCITYTNLRSQLAMNQEALDIDKDSVGAIWLPHYHDFALISSILSAIVSDGSHLCMMSPLDFIQRPASWFDMIHSSRATHTAGPNFAYEIMINKVDDAKLKDWDLSCLKVAMSAAEPIRDHTVRRFNEKFKACGFEASSFYPAYGLAEHTVGVTIGGTAPLPLDKSYLESQGIARVEEGSSYKIWTCGPAMPGVNVQIVDPQTSEVKEERHVGEVWVDSDSKGDGYWNAPQLNKERFEANIKGDTTGTGYLRTGDLGFMHEGELYITGRLKDLIIVRGRNLYPQDLEATAERACEQVRPGKVIAFAQPLEQGERVCLFFEHRSKTALTDDEYDSIMKTMKDAIASQHQVQLDVCGALKRGALPLSSSGKPQRRKCLQLYSSKGLEMHAVREFSNTTDHPDLSRTTGKDSVPNDAYRQIESEVGEGFENLARTKKGRATHTVGLAARGTMSWELDPSVPSHSFFEEKSENCQVVLRHASIKGFDDDAVLDGRGASLRIQRANGSYQDLIMSTGECFFRPTAASFSEWFAADLKGRSKILEREPSIVEQVRHIFCQPDSYTDVPYYTQVPVLLKSDNQKDYLVRFRLKTEHAVHQPVSKEELNLPYDYVPRRDNDKRPTDYLRQELCSRLEEAPVTYSLEMQCYETKTSDLSGPDAETMDCTQRWDETSHPWISLGCIEVESLLDEEDEKELKFNVQCLTGFVEVPTIEDHNHPGSLNYLRSQVYRRSAQARSKAKRSKGADSHHEPSAVSPEASWDLTTPALKEFQVTGFQSSLEASRWFSRIGKGLYRSSFDLEHETFVQASSSLLRMAFEEQDLDVNLAVEGLCQQYNLDDIAERLKSELVSQTEPPEDMAPVLDIAAKNNLDWYNGEERQEQIQAMDDFTKLFPQPAFRTSASIDKYSIMLWEREDVRSYFERLTFMDKPSIRTRMIASPYFLAPINDNFAVILLRANTNANIEEHQINDATSPIVEYIFVLSKESDRWGLVGVFNSRADNPPNLSPAELNQYIKDWVGFKDFEVEPESATNVLKNKLFSALFLTEAYRAVATGTPVDETPKALQLAGELTAKRDAELKMSADTRIAIIGAGVSGLSCAHYLKDMGYQNVHIFESNEQVAGKAATLYVEGKPYDLGAHVISTKHSKKHPHLIQLLDSYGVELETVTPYTPFDSEKNAVDVLISPELGLKTIIKDENFSLASSPREQDRAHAFPGGVSDWLEERDLLVNPWNLPYISSGYGYIDDTTPASRFIKMVEWTLEISDMAHTPKEGFQELWERVASQFGSNLHLNAPVEQIERYSNGTVGVSFSNADESTEANTEVFDKVILCCPPKLVPRLMGEQMNANERDIFSKVQSIHYFTTVCKIEDLPKNGFYLLSKECADSSMKGHVVAYHHRHDSSNIYTLYSYGREGDGPGEILQFLEEDVARMGGSVEETLLGPIHWDYSPHFSPEDMEMGLLDRYEGLQGRGGVYYSSALGNFELVDCCVEYSRDLVQSHFGRKREAALWSVLSEGFVTEEVQAPSVNRTDLENLLQDLISSALQCPKESIDLAEPLESFGLDSLTIFQLLGNLSRAMGHALTPQVVVKYTSFAALLDGELNSRDRVEESLEWVEPQSRVSEAQQAFAFQTLQQPGSFQNVYAFHIKSDLPPAHIAKALKDTIAVLPGLRTVVDGDKVVVQEKIHPAAFAGVLQPKPLVELEALLTKEATNFLDLTKTPVRWTLLQNEKERVLMMRLSHICYDASSSFVINQTIQSMIQKYESNCEAKPSSMKMPSPDFFVAEQSYLGSSDYQADLDYWKSMASKQTGVVDVDVDIPLQHIQRVSVGSASLLRSRSKEHRCTPNSGLLWAYGQAASEVLSVEELTLGIAVDLRILFGLEHAELEDAACAINWVPIFFRRDMDPSELHQQSFLATTHARLPNRKMRDLFGWKHIHPSLMFFSYFDIPTPPVTKGPNVLERIDTSKLSVVRPNLLQGFAREGNGEILFDARSRLPEDAFLAALRKAILSF